MMKWIRRKIDRMIDDMMEKKCQDMITESVDDTMENFKRGAMDDIVSNLDYQDLAYNIDVDDIAYNICASDVADHMCSSTVAEYIEVDPADVPMEYDELTLHVVGELDLEEIARLADVDATIFSHIHMLETKIDALIAVVSESAQNTLDLMTFNKGLEGEE